MYKSPIVTPVEGIDLLSPSCRRSGRHDSLQQRAQTRHSGSASLIGATTMYKPKDNRALLDQMNKGQYEMTEDGAIRCA